jgi:hypothetical protein
VLRHQGHDVELDEIVALCRLGPFGALQDRAAQSLREAGWDVELVDEFDVEAVKAAIEEGRPLVVSLDLGRVGEAEFAHAVVICDIGRDTVVVMDPWYGDYRELRMVDVMLQVGRGLSGMLLIGGKSQPPEAAS